MDSLSSNCEMYTHGTKSDTLAPQDIYDAKLTTLSVYHCYKDKNKDN